MGGDHVDMESPFRADCLKDCVALITGGGSGIGLGVANVLGQHGAKVVLMGRRQQFLDDAVSSLSAQGIEACSFSGDVRKEADAQAAVQKAVTTFGHLSMLVNSAAGNFLALPEELNVKGFQTVMEIDAMGVFN